MLRTSTESKPNLAVPAAAAVPAQRKRDAFTAYAAVHELGRSVSRASK